MGMHVRSSAQPQGNVPNPGAAAPNPKFATNLNMVVPSNVAQFKLAPHYLGNPTDDPYYLLGSTKRPKANLEVFTEAAGAAPVRLALQNYSEQECYAPEGGPKQIDWDKVSMDNSAAPVAHAADIDTPIQR